MSKRTHAEFAAREETSVLKILEHATDLLKAAEALKKELDTFRESPDIISVLQRHNKKILQSVQLLNQDETNVIGQPEPESRKIQKLDEDAKAKSSDASKAFSIPPPISLSRWTPDDIPTSGLPPLPPILNPTLEQAALTHSGMVMKPTEMSYERLEWIGDAYLYLMSTSFIYQTFPNLGPGRSSQLRERLIKNEALSDFTVQYGINKRTKFPAEFDLNGRVGGSLTSQNTRRKVLGDVFEAYVAAVILSDPEGLSRVSPWIKSLWSTKIAKEIKEQSRVQSFLAAGPTNDSSKSGNDGGNQKAPKQELHPKVLLSQALGAVGVKISYNDVGQPKLDKVSGKLPLYTVGVFLDGLGEKNLQLGIGSALSKKEAGANAALAALQSKKMIRRLQRKRDEFLEFAKQAKAAEAAEAAGSTESTQKEYDNWS
ncbi:ribonuclease III [Annulohypoxylon stygium]|nr:ribonuclease III [Annulohypoxylon stygium]